MTINPLPKKLSSNVLEASALTTSGVALILELGFLPALAPLWLYLGWDLIKRRNKQAQPQSVPSHQESSPTVTKTATQPARVGIFVDHGNLEYAAQLLNFNVDYQALLTFLQGESPLAGAWFYTKINPNNKGTKRFYDFLKHQGYEVKAQKTDRANDNSHSHQLALDLEEFANQFDIAIILSNDEQFTPAVQTLQQQGKQVKLIGHRTASNDELIEAVDHFTPLPEIKDQINRN
ncbi:MAG: NYN domain-containing protein [Halothece sp.]